MEKSVLDIICASLDSFFESERKIGTYIIQHTAEVVDMTVGELAQACGVSDASVSRFCKKINMKGFHHLKITLAKEISEKGIEEEEVSNHISVNDIEQSLKNILANKVTEITQTVSMMDAKQLPGFWVSVAPIFIPIILILINTVATAMGKTEGFMNILVFLGQPIVAVGLGLIVAILTLGRSLDRHEALAEMEKGMASAGIIMLVTGGGGALGQIIKDSGLGTFMAEGLAKTAIPIIILPLLIATAMRFIQGSGTVAMTTAASITAPIIAASGVSPILGAVACCVGSLFFGYFNDSYFWVVNRTLGVSEAKDQLTIWSVTSTVAWAVGVVEVLILNIFM